MPEQAVSELAPTGVLRAAINMGNFLLVTGRSPSGDPVGVAPDMAREIAQRLGVPVAYVPYARPGELADAAGTGVWDIGLIGAEPQRAAKIDFTPAYVEIEATYLVPAGSPIKTIAEVDQPGRRVAVTARSAYGLWLENNYKKGELLQFENAEAALKAFDGEKLDAYAGLRPGLIEVQQGRPGARDPRRPVRRGAAGRRHRPHQRRRCGFPARICRGGEEIRPRRPPDRAPRRRRPAVGRPTGLSAPKGLSQIYRDDRLSRGSGNPGLARRGSPWTPVFAGATVRCGDRRLIFGSP